MPAIDFDTLFDRLGRLGHVGYVLAGNQAAVDGLITDFIDDYEGTTDVDLVGNVISAIPQLPAPVVGPVQQIAQVGETTLVRMVQASVPSINDVASALTELVRQMNAEAESVAECAVTVAAVALTTNTGNGVVVVSEKRGDGLVQENTVAEVLRLQCQADSYTGGQTEGQESFLLAGAVNGAELWDHDYPRGSQASAFTQSVPANTGASQSGNLLTNGDMEDWSADATPELSNWVLDLGTWGTDVARSSTAYTGTYSLRFLPGATNSEIYQEFGDGTAGTTPVPLPLVSYAVNFFARELAGTVSAGVLTVELVDDTGAVVNDEQGTPNAFTLTASSLSTAWVAVNGVFRIPNVPPDVMRLRFRISTDLATDSLLVDDVSMAPLVSSYPGGFGFRVFSGSTPFVLGDGWDVTATNDRAGESYLGTFQALFQRLFDTMTKGILLPSSGTPTQADTKITT